ncbi:MAG: calycin-like domain-containing protein [Bacteroides sp.]|nr:calycin-like domain-containing protein [Bacteroides sp.]
MKKTILGLCALMCCAGLFTACGDGDDNPAPVLTVDNITGTYTGSLEVLGSTIPGTSISLSKLDAQTVNMQLKDFAMGELAIGDISAACNVTPDGDDFNLYGTTDLVLEALGGATVLVTIDGEADGKTLDVDLNISNVPGLGNFKVEFEGTK